jgi:TP901 family phage tail tape measure protein
VAATVSELQVVVSADTSKAESGLTSFSSKLGSVGGTMATAFGAAAIGGVVALGGAMVAATASAAGFESQMSAIKAVSGATGSEMEALQAKALQLGADTSFSASEAAAGIEELIKAGVSVADVLGGGAAAALSLAAAGGLSVAESASIASNAMNVFSLSGGDVGHVADVIAGAANASAIDVHDFGMSLSAAGAVAATVGIGFDDLGTAIAVMGQAGIKGSDAGTSLKTMLLNLTPSSKAQIAVAKELGIVTADGANKFFDASGKAKSLSEIAGVLQTATAGLTEQQKLQALQTLFGTDAIRAAAIMAKAGSEGFDEMAASIGKVTAESVAAERLNNLTGAIGQLGGSIETVAIKMGLQLTPIIRDVVDSLTKMVNDAGPLLEQFAGFFSEKLASGIAIGKDALRQLGDAWTTVQQVFAGDWSPSDKIEPLALAAGNAATKVKEISEWLGKIATAAGQMGAWDNFVSGLQTLGVESEVAQANLGKIVGQLDRLTGAAGNSGTTISALAAGVKVGGVAFELWALSIGGAIDIMTTFASEGLSFIGIVGNMGKALKSLATGDMDGYKEAMKGVSQGVVEMAFTHQGAMDRTAERAKQAYQAITNSATTESAATQSAVETGMAAANQAVGTNSAGMQRFMEENGAGMTVAAQSAGSGVSVAIETGMTTAATSASTNGAAMSTSLETAGTAMTTAAQTGATGVTSAVQTQGPLATAAADSMGTGMSGAIERAGPLMAAAAESGASSAVSAVQGQTGAAQSAGQSVGQSAGEGIRNGIMSMVNSIASAAASVVSRALAAARQAGGGDDNFHDGRASGGPVSAGRTYMVGERGPELFTPGAGGYITPNHQLTAPSVAMSSGGGMQTIRLDVAIGGRVAENIVVEGYDLAVRRGRLPALGAS